MSWVPASNREKNATPTHHSFMDRHLAHAPFQIVIKEIGIQQCLNHPTNIHNPVMPVVLFVIGSVNPVKNVQRSVGTHEKDVVSRQVLDFAVALQDHQLRHNGDAFQKNGKSP